MAGKKLEAARRELDFARQALEGLRQAKSDPGREDFYWKEFIGRLTRFWNKTLSAVNGDPRFTNSPTVKRVNTARKKDELIQYLMQARHADEHRHEEVTSVMPEGFVNISADGRVWARNPKITIGGVTMDVPPAPGFTRKKVSAELRLNKARNKDQVYEVPRTHLGQDIALASLTTCAELGLAFYESVLGGLVAEGWDAT
jgi:hypothetical protein